VVRDPRDVYVSLFHHEMSLREDREKTLQIHRYFRSDPNASIRENFATYLQARLNVRMHPWFFYSEFLDSWLDRPRICVVRYEDMLAEPEHELARIIRFTGRRVDMNRVRAAVEENSFAAQTKARYGSSREPGEADNTKFLRKGIAGDWKNHFNAHSCDLIWTFEGSSLKRLGYEEDSRWIAEFLSELETQDEAPPPDAESAS
jgi:hypothetical protein